MRVPVGEHGLPVPFGDAARIRFEAQTTPHPFLGMWATPYPRPGFAVKRL